jgi:hypothetical protein
VERITEWRGSATASRRQAVAVLTSARGRNGEREKYPHRPVALIGEGEREREGLDGSLKSATDVGVVPESVTSGMR